MRKVHLKTFTVASLLLLAIAAAPKIYAVEEVQSSLATVYCGDTFNLQLKNLNKEDFLTHNWYYLRRTCTTAATCGTDSHTELVDNNLVWGGVTQFIQNADGTGNVTLSLSPNIQGFTCATSPNLTIAKMGTYEVGIVKHNGATYTRVGPSISITFNAFGDLVQTQCQTTLRPETYVQDGSGTIGVTGRTNYLYTATNTANGKTKTFFLPYQNIATQGFYTNDIPFDPGFFQPGANIVNIIGTPTANPPVPGVGTIQCQATVIRLNTRFTTSEDSQCTDPTSTGCKIRLNCNDSITFNAAGLDTGRTYQLKMKQTACGEYPSCTLPTEILLGQTNGTSTRLDVTKSFKIGGLCGSGDPIDAGNYTVTLVAGTDVYGTRNLELRGQNLSCATSDVISPVYSFSGGSDSGFKLNGAPNTKYNLFSLWNMQRTDLPSVTTPSSGQAVITLPHSLFVNKEGTHIISITKDGDPSNTCGANIDVRSNYDCTAPLNDQSACSQCPTLNGVKQICVALKNGEYGCRNDTQAICENLNTPPPPTCDASTLETACASCGVGFICKSTSATAPVTCERDSENACGRPVYPILDGITGSFKTFPEFLDALRGILIPLGIVLGLVFFLICGYKFMTSQGQPDKMRDAKECLTSAIIGLLVVTMSVSIINTLINLAFKVM